MSVPSATKLEEPTTGNATAPSAAATFSFPPTSQKPLLVLEPVSGWRALRLGELWEFRDLLFALGSRDVKLVYKQTLLGVAWVLLQPLIGAGIFTLVFGVLAGMGTSFVASFAGMAAWTLFSATLTGASGALVNNGHLVSKVYFPRLIMPLAAAFQPVVNFGVALALLAALVSIARIPMGFAVLMLPVWAALLLMFALGVGCWVGGLMVRYRDLRFVIPVAIQFLLYASPVGYSLASVEDRLPPWGRTLYNLNPMSPLLEAFRWSTVGGAVPHVGWLLYAATASVLTFAAGLVLFRRMERHFADVI